MEAVFAFFSTHGVAAVFFSVLLKQVGAPLPAVPFLLLAGARGVHEPLFLASAFVAATAASAAADYLWYLGGKRWGRSMLALLGRAAGAPEGCLRQHEQAFARRSALAIVASKFVPGISLLAPPLAGVVGMRAATFLWLDVAASALWAGLALGLGFIFRDEVVLALEVLQAHGSTAILWLAAAVGAWMAWRLGRRLLAAAILALQAGRFPA